MSTCQAPRWPSTSSPTTSTTKPLGYNGYSAGPGYDLVTGLGSPVANQLIPDLDNNVLYQDNPVLDTSNSEPRVDSPLVYEAPEGQGGEQPWSVPLRPIIGITNNGQIVATGQALYTSALDIIGAKNTANTLTIDDFGATVTGVGTPPYRLSRRPAGDLRWREATAL